MGTPYMSEIRLMAFNFAPKGWALCNGQLLPINQNQALFSLLGTTYGGDGRVSFALPNLQGNVPIHVGQGFTLGQKGGEQAHTLTISEMPLHTHVAQASLTQGNSTNPNFNNVGNILAQDPGNIYNPPVNLVALNAGTIANTGGSQAHLNMQ